MLIMSNDRAPHQLNEINELRAFRDFEGALSVLVQCSNRQIAAENGCARRPNHLTKSTPRGPKSALLAELF